MDFPVWILYTLFLVHADGNNYVLEGHIFQSKAQCLQYTRENVVQLGTNAWTNLTRKYGNDGFVPLEIGCVPKDHNMVEHPNKRIPIVKVPWGNEKQEPKGELL